MIEEGVRLIGNVKLGEGVSIGAPAELMAKDSLIEIGDGCDIAAFVSITTADSHMRCLGLMDKVERADIRIGRNVFIGQGAIILKGTTIGHHSVIGAGVVLKGQAIPPYSRVRLPEPIIDRGFYGSEKARALADAGDILRGLGGL